MSTIVLTTRAKPVPRWSVVSAAAALLLPASIAGLPASRARVSVGPPLSCNGPRPGVSVNTL